MNRMSHRVLTILLLFLILGLSAFAQITPSQDSYTNTASATTNFGTSATLGVVSSATSIQTTYIQFDLSSVPAGYTSANVAKATLKLYVNSVSTAGSFNVDFVNGSWSEKTITASLAPALGTTIASSVPLTAASVHDYVLIDMTSAVGDWLNGSQANDGIALVANSPLSATIDSKENSAQSQPAELDIVFTSGGTISGVTTASGSGLTGGGTSGTLNLSLQKTCSSKQILQWNGSAWVCATPGTGSVSSVGLSAPATDFTVSGSPVTGTGTLSFNWNVAPTSFDNSNAIVKRDANGNFSASTINAINLNAANATLADNLTINTSYTLPVSLQTSTTSATGIYAAATATTGAGWGVEGVTDSNIGSAYGVIGWADASTGDPIGVYGYAPFSSSAIGVFGQNGIGESSAGASFSGFIGAGIWGDTINSADAAVLGTSDNGYAGLFANNASSGLETVVISAFNGASPTLVAGDGNGGHCEFDAHSNLSCTGTKNAVVPIDGGTRQVALSAIESPVNWFEDFGSGQLVNGVAVVRLDADFMQTVNTEKDYKVFPVPSGDCKGLYVTQKTASSFEVRELGGGTSNVSFDYRITALRKNYENVRFADYTKDWQKHEQTLMRLRTAKSAAGSSHTPTKLMPARHQTASTQSPATLKK